MNELTMGMLDDGREITAVFYEQYRRRIIVKVDGKDWLTVYVDNQERGLRVACTIGATLAIVPRATNAIVIPA